MEQTATTGLERTPLKGHTPHSRTTIHGWPALLFGIPFGGAGAATLMLAAGWIDYPKGSVHAPMWVIGVVGGVFLAAGLWLMIHGAEGIGRHSRLRDEKRRRPASPWLWDYSWHAKGVSERKLREAISSVVGLIAFGTFLAPFNWLAFFSEHDLWFFKGIVGFLDVVITLGVGSHAFKKIAQLLKFGSGRLGFHHFPFFLGDTMKLTVQGLPRQLNGLHLTLRFIEEAYEVRGTGRDRTSHVVCYQRYHDSRTLSGRDVGQTGRLYVEWTLPEDQTLGSRLSERPAKFWELELTGDTPGVNYYSRFPLPVYARPS